MASIYRESTYYATEWFTYIAIVWLARISFVKTYRSRMHHIMHIVLFWVFVVFLYKFLRTMYISFSIMSNLMWLGQKKIVHCNWAKAIYVFKPLKCKDTSLVVISVSCLRRWSLLVDPIIPEGRNKDVIFRRYPWLIILVWLPFRNQLLLTH